MLFYLYSYAVHYLEGASATVTNTGFCDILVPWRMVRYISHVCGQMIKNCRSLTILEHKFQIFKCCFQWYNYVHNNLKGLLLGVTNTIFSQILVSWKILRSIPLVCGQMVKDCRSMIIPGYALKALFSRESSTLCCFI